MIMKQIIFLLIGLLYFTVGQAKSTPSPTSQDKITVYVFLHEACVISQYYTLPLRQMHEEYANENLQFVGLFPNASSQVDKIQAFKESYKIPFALQIDEEQVKTEAFGATITPEVVVYNETQAEIMYQGRIDDAYARVGQRKRVTNTSELKDVLEAIANNQAILVRKTPAVGCFITKTNPN